MASVRTDLDAEIVAARVAGVPEREICRRLGCARARVEAALDAWAARKLAPENVVRMLVDDLGRLSELERVFAPMAAAGDVGAAKLVRQARRQRARTGNLILRRAPASRPM
jgi:hypothetical protein